ncbi:MAG: TetR/AcrR family transcriptional regulator [Caulobacterales bacterium]
MPRAQAETLSPVGAETNTKDRILEASLHLFNADGVEATSIAAISLRAGIAPGNLTYHFPKKREIIIEILARFEAAMDAINRDLLDGLVRGERSVTAAETVQFLVATMRAIWSNRFFFTSIPAMQDKVILARLSKIETRALSGISQLMQKALDVQVLAPLRYPNTTSVLAENVWHLLWGRIFFQRVGGGNSATLERAVVHKMLTHVGALIQPHTTPEFVTAFCDEINAR